MKTTIADPDGVIHTVTYEPIPPTVDDGTGIHISVRCGAALGVMGMIAARYARTLHHPVFQRRPVTCGGCS